jgi:trigger factor
VPKGVRVQVPPSPSRYFEKECILKIEQKKRDDHQVNVIVECDSEQLDQYSTKAAQKISRDSKVPGFRPGKAPASVIRRMYGDEYIQNRAIELLVDDIYPLMLDETKIKPSGPGSLEQIISNNPPKFSFIVPLEPEVDLKNYLSIRKTYTPPTLDEVEVKKTLTEFQRMLAVAEPVERPAASGDMVYLKLSGTIQNPSEGQDPFILKESDTQVWIGDESEEEPFPYKGFDNVLVGLSSDETKTVTYKYKKDSKYTDLQGKTVDYEVKVLSVKIMKLPDLNDEFAKSLGNFESYDALVESIRSRLIERNQDSYDKKYFEDLLDEITAQSVIAYPPQMLDDEVEHLLDHFKQDLAEQKLDIDAYLKLNNKEKDKFIEEELKPEAKKRLERSLVLEQVAKSENIQLSQEEISRELNATLSNLQNTKDFQKLNRKSNSQQLMNAMAVQAASRAMNRRVLDLIKSIASGEYQKKEKPENISAKKKTAKKTASKSDKTKEKSVDSIKESKTAKSSPKSSNKKSGDK